MADVSTEIKIIEFVIEKELTHCNIYMTSSDPHSPIWGNGWRTKTFPASKASADIMLEDVHKYFEWTQGRNHYKG